MIPLFDLKAQYESIKPEIDDAVNRVISSGHYIGGDEVAMFEQELALKLKVKHAVSCASGTDALILALRASSIGPGDEVIVPAFSFWATASAVLHVGAKPVFVDITHNAGIDISKLEQHLNSLTAAIIPVHLYGHPVNMGKLMAFAEPYGLAVIEDTAQALGAADMHTHKPAGTIGDMGCLSFFPTKPLGCAGDGGAILTNNDDYAARLRILKSHGWSQKYFPETLGYNSRLDAVQAAILRVKLKHVLGWNIARNRIAGCYEDAFSRHINFVWPSFPNLSACHLFVIDVRDRDRVQQYLKSKGIETGIYYPQILPDVEIVQEQNTTAKYPVASYARDHWLAIPCYAEMTGQQINQVIEAVLEAVRE